MARSKQTDLARLFHLNSSNVRCRLIETELDHDRHPARFRTYIGSQRVPLPGRDFQLTAELGELLRQRRSIRAFQPKALPLEMVGRLLHASYGVRGYVQIESEWVYDRPSPSAGGLYPLEIYVAAQAVEGLEDGIYHYDPVAHELEMRQSGVFHGKIADMTLGQHMIQDANLVLIITAVFERTMWKYGQRGYRYVWLDAGHLGENLYLVAGALGLGPVAIGGFLDEELNRLLMLPPDQEEAIYLLCIGQPGDANVSSEP